MEFVVNYNIPEKDATHLEASWSCECDEGTFRWELVLVDGVPDIEATIDQWQERQIRMMRLRQELGLDYEGVDLGNP
jgi:hypothetical protein